TRDRAASNSSGCYKNPSKRLSFCHSSNLPHPPRRTLPQPEKASQPANQEEEGIQRERQRQRQRERERERQREEAFFQEWIEMAAFALLLCASVPHAGALFASLDWEGEGRRGGEMKYVLVTGGVVSGLGKGVTASSIGVILKACGLRVTSIKIDPYLNTDAGTMSPFEHGEVFVLDDGGETIYRERLAVQELTTSFDFLKVDLDLGNYERFLDIKLTCNNNITTGKIYQVVPHITDAIQEWIERVAMIPVDGQEGPADICVIELGGTIGDIESMPFIEALGQFSYRVGPGNFCLVHVSLVPVLNVVGEQKTKPTQHSVRGLRGLGLTPNILACRSTTVRLSLCLSVSLYMQSVWEEKWNLKSGGNDVTTFGIMVLEENVMAKLSQFCHVPDQKAHEAILKVLNLTGVSKEPMLQEWTQMAKTCDMLRSPVRIAMVGKYTGLSDSYLSVLKSKALLHASVICRRKLIVEWVPASDLEDTAAKETPDAHKDAWNLLKGADGILVPGGFGDRGVQGKILAAKYARENRVPFFGICLGMQIAVIEFARSVLGLHNANSTEFDPETTNPCVIFMPEVNPDMVPELEGAGLSFVGKDESGQRMEIVELPNHPYFVGVQFHPEFKSRPGKPSALFLGLIAASCGLLETALQDPSQVVKVAAAKVTSNGFAKVYQNGNISKPANRSMTNCNGHSYANGNGVHI
ncbi:hypothetical protein ACLOJK_008526, partial [Asimina triloba]